MEIIIFVVATFISFFISTFTVIPVLIILFFGIPTTKSLEKAGFLKKDNKIMRSHFISLVLLSSIYLGIGVAIFIFLPNILIAYLIGTVIPLIMGMGQLGKNKNNVSDYIETNKNDFSQPIEKITEYIIHG